MKKIMLVSLAVMLMVGILGISALAYGPGNGQNLPGKNNCPPAANKLNLTAEQEQKMLSLRQEFQKETLSLRQEMQTKSLELRQLWNAKPLNQTAIDAKTKELTALRIQMKTKIDAFQSKVRNILTPEQQKQFDSNMANRGQGFGGKHHGAGMGGCFNR